MVGSFVELKRVTKERAEAELNRRKMKENQARQKTDLESKEKERFFILVPFLSRNQRQNGLVVGQQDDSEWNGLEKKGTKRGIFI